MNLKDGKYLIVDDEPLAIDLIATFLARLDIHHITRCDNGIEAFQRLQNEKFDLVFLDIEMPLVNGLDLVRHLTQRPAIVITTAYRDYAVEGFDLEVLDYLVKPFSFPRFLQTMDKFGRLFPANPPTNAATSPPASPSSNTVDPPSLVFKADRQLIRIELADIHYIESKKDYIRINSTRGEWLCHQSLAAITSQLPAHQFLRIHRSFTVALIKIERFHDNCVTINGKLIPVSRENRHELRRRLHP